MFKEIFLFELFYRKSRTVTYVYFGLTFLLCFLGVASSIIKLGGAVGMIKANAPYIIYRMTLVASFVLMIVTSAIMGVAIVRDFDHNMHGLLFSMPIKKWAYLMGRFLGSFLVLIAINLAMPLGFIAGFAVGQYLPWEVVWKNEEIFPFSYWSYVNPFLLFLIPNVFTTSALFFMSGALGRKSIVIYMQGILLVILYQIGNSYLKDLNSQYLAAIIDPLGIQTFLYTTRYWTPAEQNILFVPFEGLMLLNRLLWIGVGALALLVTYVFFRFNSVPDSGGKKIRLSIEPSESEAWVVPKVQQVINSGTYLKQILESSLFYFKMIWKEIPFLAIVGAGILLLLIGASRVNSIYGTSSYPTTGAMLDVINNSFSLFFLIIVVFYSGELIWKERSLNFNMIIDSLPVSNTVSLLSKFTGLLITYISLLLLLIICGVVSQTAYGYFAFDLPVYFKTLFGSTFVDLILVTLLSFFIQVLVNNKFGGFVITILFLVANAMLSFAGLEQKLWQFGSGSLGLFSDINQYGHFVLSFVWYKTYWTSCALILLAIAIIFFPRGTDTALLHRWKAGRSRITKPLLVFAISMGCLFLFSGFYIYYNTNVLNKFEGSDEHKQKQADYEKSLSKYENLVQPKIVEANLAVNIFPSTRSFTSTGYYYLKNKSTEPITDIHIHYAIDDQLNSDDLNFDRYAELKESSPHFRYYIYELRPALKPGDSLKMLFKLSFKTSGFVEGKTNTDIVYNGTFFNNMYFPGLGYDHSFELTDPTDRKKYGLEKKDRLPDQKDPKAKLTNIFGAEADHIRFEMVVSTDHDQTAIAPGTLQKKWTVNGRNYFRYKTEIPISNFYAVISARYRVKQARWKNTNLEIYYHPGHEFNLEKMMKGMKDALDYCTTNFGPYQYSQLRIVEFPRYNTFAQSFAGTVPYSEGVGFMLKVAHPDKDIDMAYYVTAHEVAHQWWGQQVAEAKAKGSAMLSEGMSQYVALMIMKHTFGSEMLERYLNYELDSYLKGRTLERKKELPLMSTENQPYVHYNKASIIFFALQDYIGEENLNLAFRKYKEAWAFKDAPYPVSNDLLEQIRKVTPDSLQYLIKDLFESVTLFENKAVQAVVKEGKNGKFELTLSVSSEKLRIDSAGQEIKVPLADWIDVGVYGLDAQGNEKLIYLKKYKIEKQDNRFTISLNKKPTRAGLDPLHKIIDRHSEDNLINVTEFIEITSLPFE